MAETKRKKARRSPKSSPASSRSENLVGLSSHFGTADVAGSSSSSHVPALVKLELRVEAALVKLELRCLASRACSGEAARLEHSGASSSFLCRAALAASAAAVAAATSEG